MKSFLYLLTLAAAISISALTQQPATTPQNSPPPANTPVEQQRNAASATKDNSGISGDQVTKPSGAKGTTLIGCLSGPDADGKYVLTSMQHRTGVQVLGPDDLRNDSGNKVKLTGAWEASPQAQPQTKAKEARRFQVTAVEVLSQHLQSPQRDNAGQQGKTAAAGAATTAEAAPGSRDNAQFALLATIQNTFFESSRIVTGPLFTSSTSIIS